MSGVPIKVIHAPVHCRDFCEVRDNVLYRPDLAPGTARFRDYGTGTAQILEYVCPCGCSFVNFIAIYAGETGHGWKWNGDRERPTLTPSIQQLNACRWHGFLTDGEWVKA